MANKVKQHLKHVQRTARYYTLGALTERTKTLWLCCHGYGQVAERFAGRLAPLVDDENFVLAPEGLNRFYWHGPKRTPVATWMTRAARLHEIDDYVRYLDGLVDDHLAQVSQPLEVVAFGFSQGSQTIFRYLHATRRPEVSRVVAYAGAIPDDLEYAPLLDYFADRPITFAVGDADEFLTSEVLTKYRTFLRETGLTYAELPFSGGHQVLPEVLERIRERGLLK